MIAHGNANEPDPIEALEKLKNVAIALKYKISLGYNHSWSLIYVFVYIIYYDHILYNCNGWHGTQTQVIRIYAKAPIR